MTNTNVNILGICGSPRDSVTRQALDLALRAAQSVGGVETHSINLCGKNIQCCRNCNVCLKTGCGYCPVIKDDMSLEYYDFYKNCDGIILASPLYYMTSTGLLQNFMSRMRPFSKYARQGRFGSRMGTGIAVGGMRNGGQDFCLSVLNNMLQATGTNIIGGGVQFYNGAAVCSENGTLLTDQIGAAEVTAAGKKLAYMCKIIRLGIDASHPPVNSANFLGFEDADELAAGAQLRGLS